MKNTEELEETIHDLQELVRNKLLEACERVGIRIDIDGAGSDGDEVAFTASELDQGLGALVETILSLR
jgi:hypothetical protein